VRPARASIAAHVHHGLLGLFLWTTLLCTAATAQSASAPSWLTLDTSADVDRSVDENGETTSGAVLDAYVAARVAPGVELVTRPWVQRLASGEWNRQVWLAAVRYEHKGPIGLRIEGGLITPPVGLANLSLRPHLNPTISQPSALYQGLPPPDVGSPRITLLGALYPFGVSATVSGSHWDARGALIDTSPLRARRVFGDANPPRFANIVIGGGVTPMVGLRIGGSVTRGGWLRADERPLDPVDRQATIVTVEAEWSFRYTKLATEWVRDSLETATGHAVERGWYVQGQQTLTPRWFLAGRVERISSPVAVPVSSGATPGLRRSLAGTEGTVGFRLTPELTLRASYRARRPFSQDVFQHEATGSVVWARRWF
jgi:hypothetical protein